MAAIVVGWQQAGTGAVGAGIQLHAEHGFGIQTKANGASGKAGLQVNNETLRPLFPLGLASAFTKVAIEIDIAGAELGAAVFDETFCM